MSENGECPEAIALVGHYLLSKTSRASKTSNKHEVFMTADPFQLTIPLNKATSLERSVVEPRQFRIDENRGILIVGSAKGRVVCMPSEVENVGAFEYKSRSTILTNSDGRFERDISTGKMAFTDTLGNIYLPHTRDKYLIRRANGNEICFTKNHATSAMDRYWNFGQYWLFERDGSFTMHSFPSGKYHLEVGADGRGREITILEKNGKTEENQVRYDPDTRRVGAYIMPVITPMSSAAKEGVDKARSVLEHLTRPT